MKRAIKEDAAYDEESNNIVATTDPDEEYLTFNFADEMGAYIQANMMNYIQEVYGSAAQNQDKPETN